MCGEVRGIIGIVEAPLISKRADIILILDSGARLCSENYNPLCPDPTSRKKTERMIKSTAKHLLFPYLSNCFVSQNSFQFGKHNFS